MPRVKSNKYNKVYFRCDICGELCCFGYKAKDRYYCACREHKKEVEKRIESKLWTGIKSAKLL